MVDRDVLLMLDGIRQVTRISTLNQEDEELLKNTFKKILDSGKSYSIDDIENWIKSCGDKPTSVVERILNIAHYQKAKYDAANKLRLMSDNCGCGGNC